MSAIALGSRRLLVGCMSALALAGCDSGGGSASSAGGVVSVPATVTTPKPSSATPADAARLAKQATFGPDVATVERIAAIGVDAWITEQFGLSNSNYQGLMQPVRKDHCAGSSDYATCEFQTKLRGPVAARFYANAVTQPDQLRQRTAFALAQLLTVSNVEMHMTASLAAYNQLLLDHAFGNFGDLLKAVTMNGYMGRYLDMAESKVTAPSENYARELLQLFSMGPEQLEMDGTVRRDASGAPLENYSMDDIRGVSRALTGWLYAPMPGAGKFDWAASDHTKPMIIGDTNWYDRGEKRFLGTSIAGGASPDQSVAAVVNTAFRNASTAPFISRHLIRHLVTSNPSPDYVRRVAQVFVDNGSGVRGDMKAVIRAILTDVEARTPTGPAAAGKLKEPVLLMTSLARVIGVQSDGGAMIERDEALGQPVFNAVSVFGFYPSEKGLPGRPGWRSPVSGLVSVSTSVTWHNLVHDWTILGDAEKRPEYRVQARLPGALGTTPAWINWETFGSDVDGMIARIDLLMLANSMTASQRAALKSAAMAITDADERRQARRRAQAMLYVVGTSPAFLVDR